MEDYSFSPATQVLVRNNEYETWKSDFFQDRIRGEDKEFICCSGVYKYCIPYSRDLWGTNYSPEEVLPPKYAELKFGDTIQDILTKRNYRFIRKSSDGELTCYDEEKDCIVYSKHYEKINNEK